ncbi:MAG: AAA family ATPase [Geminicoccaceae bacterium]
MRLRRIEIRSFRKLAGPVVLDGLGDGLVLVSGANEEGKSTVLAALKAAFFEHHGVGGAVREAMAPHGGGTPEIAIGFESGGRSYQLAKAFRKGGIGLECGAERWTDDAAERRLQELLGFERRQARTPKPENAGLQALFWVDQATTFQGFEAVAGGRDRLSTAIAGEIGAVAGGGRVQALLATARERAAALLTPGQQRETGALKVAGERLQARIAERDGLAERKRQHEAKVDGLARLRDERRRFIAQDEAGRVAARLAELERRIGELEGLRREADLAAESVKARGAELAGLAAAWKTRGDLIEEVRQLEAAADSLRQRLAAAGADHEAARRVSVRAAEAFAGAAAELRAAERVCAAWRDRVAAERLATELERLQAAILRADASQAAIARVTASVEANPVTGEALAKVRRLGSGLEAAQARVEAAATHIELHPEPGRRVLLAGQALDPARALMLVERGELTLEGFGRLVVLPGGSELAERQRAAAVAETALAEALSTLGAGSLAAAEHAAEARRQAEADLKRHGGELTALLDALAAASPDELRIRAAGHVAELERLSARDAAELAPAASPHAAEVARAAAALAQEAAQAAAEVAAARLAEADTLRSGLEGERKVQDRQREAASQRLALTRAAAADAMLAAQVQAAEAEQLRACQRQDALEQRLLAGDLDGLRERQKMAARELADLERERQRIERELRDHEVALRESGAGAWGERLAELEGEIAALAAEQQRLRREAQAWRLLQERLQAADQAARDTLVAPVVARLLPDLQRLFPGAEPVIDAERLSFSHLRRAGRAESFESLSVGAREQIAVLVRLAFAQLLQEHEGDPACLILDDALVYADEARFETMKAILQRAARELQILILTCRPRDYFGLDACHLRLEECSRG